MTLRSAIPAMLCLFCLIPLWGQQVLRGVVRDASTGQGLPYVNIGVVEKNLGTVSDSGGNFTLLLSSQEVSKDYNLLFSSLGYAPEAYKIQDLLKNNKILQISLSPREIQLDEVVLGATYRFEKPETIGHPYGAGMGMAYWKDQVALGGELGTEIRVLDGRRRLDKLYFEVLENVSDSVVLRINFYSLDKKGYPGENLNKSGENILYRLNKGVKRVAINLTPFDLWTSESFIVTLEYVQGFPAGRVGLILPGSRFSRLNSFKRYTSQGKWEKVKRSSVGLYLESTYFTNNPKMVQKLRIVEGVNRNEAMVSGFVFNQGKPLPETEVINLSTLRKSTTGANGRYQILAAIGDQLRFKSERYGSKTILLKKLGNLQIHLQ